MNRSALIVTVGRSRGSLAALRALSNSGWIVGVGTPDGGGMVAASRYVSRRHRVARPRGTATKFIDDVRRAVDEGAYDVVFGGADDWMAALATYRDSVPCAVAHPSGRVVLTALDKVELSTRARKAGLLAPLTVRATDEALRQWTGPAVVKCRSHWVPGQRQLHRVEARLHSDKETITYGVEAVRATGLEPVLQQPIQGQLSALIGIFHQGRLHGRVQQFSPRLWPTPSGVSARAETVPVDEELAHRAERLLDELDWSGLVELQFLTGEDGQPYLIDLNGRFYGSMGLANVARPGLPDAWGRLALGEAIPELGDAVPGLRFAWTAGDLRRARAERRPGLARDVVGTLAWARSATSSVWDPRDPGPTLDLIRHRVRAAGGAGTPESTADPE